MAQSQWVSSCSNTFESIQSGKTKILRPISRWMCYRAPSVSMGSKICDGCQRKLAKVPATASSASAVESKSAVCVDIPESLQSISQCLGKLGKMTVNQEKPPAHQLP